jgi:hypothetical protein
MSMRPYPRFERRRNSDFEKELRERARAWIPSWGLADGERDFGRALLEIAARFGTEVAERLDRAGDKMARGFLDWLAVKGDAARPARMPVVFKLVDAAREPVLARRPARMQVDVADSSVTFETETDVQLVPGKLELVVGVDPAGDAFFLPPPGLSSLEPLEPLPTRWQLKSFAAAAQTKLQLDPGIGLAPEMILDAGGAQYRITEANNDLVTVDPPLTAALDAGTVVRKVEAFAPFDPGVGNRQEHVLYIGTTELLNIEAEATLDIVGAEGLGDSIDWQYWGKAGTASDAAWQTLTVAPAQKDDALVLVKPRGAIEPRDVGGKSSRWIRGFKKTILGSTALLGADSLALRVNASGPLPAPAVTEAMANTTPLVLDADFFLPFGKEPRQFDSFYIGCAEAFSKKKADVTLRFDMADESFTALAALRSGPQANQFLAGVAKDGYLYLLSFNPSTGRPGRFANRPPLQPPSPGRFGVPVPGPAVALDQGTRFGPAVWSVDYGPIQEIFVAVTAGGTVRVWHEFTGLPSLGGWETLGTVGQTSGPIEGLVYLADTPAGMLVALRDSKLYIRDVTNPNSNWRPVETKDGAATVKLTTIAPVYSEATPLGSGVYSEGLIGIGENGKLYAVTFGGVPLAGSCTVLLSDVATDMTPAGVRRADNRLVAVAVGKPQAQRKLRAFLSTPGTLNHAVQSPAEVDLPGRGPVGYSIDVNLNGSPAPGHLVFLTSLQLDDQTTGIAAWSPFDAGVSDALFVTVIPIEIGAAGGAPSLLAAHLVVPGSTGQVMVAGFDLSQRKMHNTVLETALITATAADRLQVGDRLAIRYDDLVSTDYHLVTIAAPGIDRRGETLHAFNFDAIDDDVYVYRAGAAALSANVGAANTMTLDPGDTETEINTILLIDEGAALEVHRVIAKGGPGNDEVQLDPPLIAAPPAAISYWLPQTTGARLVPLMRLDPLTTGDWDSALLDVVALVFPGADPEQQKGTAFQVDVNRRPILVALEKPWITPPPGPGADFIIDGTVANWTSQLGDTGSNPELSWEYWNGTGWWKLKQVQNGVPSLTDTTQNLRHGGVVRFEVPPDLQPTDVSGRTNHWIRARLIGGDYGRETVTVKTVPATPPAISQQVVERSSDSIRAPSVLSLKVVYSLNEPVLPDFVLATDGGTIRDQSDANGTGGAIVEAFIPLSLQLSRLSGGQAAPKTEEDCPPDCACPGKATDCAAAAKREASIAPSAKAAPGAAERALYLGFDAKLLGQPINVLLVVEAERPHDASAPLTVDALIGGAFTAVVAKDGTRAIGESGVISLSLGTAPTVAELFGRSLSWLRLVPRGAAATWLPAVRGAYLNAAWARSAETMTRELVGSSEGAPHLVLQLARPPLLAGSLELRVNEPLGEEERTALLARDPNLVKSAEPDLPGDWVLWTQVDDPLDEDPGARVYALDEATGVLRFGDGLHGMIPPIGADCIVAFAYERTDPATADNVPANLVTARTALNLVTPIEGVETVFAADQAAGGVAPESDARVLEFGAAKLRHRGRAVTARDFEDLALARFADLVQARIFVRNGRIRLVVVMRGADPAPSRAQRRALHQLLLDAASPTLAASNALTIEGPTVRRLRIDLKLRVAALDVAGAVANAADTTLKAFFDTDTGGTDGKGWPLGRNPTQDDIAEALLDIADLESIVDIDFAEVDADGEHRWPASIKPSDLVMLADDAVRFIFEIVEVTP